ncbi:unnamed protein product [Malus baccata var. baccata]
MQNSIPFAKKRSIMALEVVGGAALSGFFQQVFVKLDSQEVKNFIRGKKLTDGLLEKLSIELMSVDAVYYDAEQKQLRDPRVKQWLHKLKEAVLRAEDLLDEIKTEALRRKIEAEFGSCTSKVQDLISASFHAFDESVDTKIEEILERLSSISKQKDVFGLKERCSHRSSQTLPSTSLVEGSEVYGRNHDTETIIQLLLSDDVTCNKIGVISIVGMGGIGKTTLAQLLYNDERVKQRFEPRAWVCVSDEFDIVKITQTIYGSVTSQTCDSTDLNQLQVKLKDALAGKKFLFVLDDVWNENYNIWDSLRRPFESGAYGSKIIVTARNDGVASTMGTLQTHYLKHLLEEDCWFLFSKHAFKDASVDPNLEEIGRQIVSKCKGLPLAAKSLGGLLRSESNVEEWENVLKSDIWEFSDAKIEILPALWLSYQYLSPVLKRCFAYCSIFPKDYRFRKSELILLWMAEDLLQPQKKTRLEDVGQKYFDDLISRSFFQYSTSNDCFIMHDLMHDLATYVSGEFCIRLEDHDFSSDVVSKGRHFSIMQSSSNVDSERFDTIYEAKNLRTFILGNHGNHISSPKVRLDLLLVLHCLRVLKLCGRDITELPDLISNLKHLRYLDLCNTQIQKLPNTVCSLCNLQTLLLSYCTCLAELPTDLRRLINLRHLDLRGTKIKKMPPHMGKLKDLQTFGGEFVLTKDAGGYIDELKGFQHLSGNLHISGLQNIKHAEDALEAKLRDKKLSEIHLKWEGDTADSQNDSRVLGNLQPNTNLKVLAIKGYGGIKFPGWLGDESFSNLITLRLENCGYCFSLPALGRLTSLKRLEIDGLNGVELVGSEFYGSAFKTLEFLSFRRMREWQEWCFPGGEEEEGGHFPNLCELSLDICPKLTGKLPLYYFPRLERLILQAVKIESLACSQECNKFNIELPSLRYLRISDCPNLVCFVGGGVLLAPNLQCISLCHLKNLWSVPEEMQISLPSLQSLSIIGSKEFKSFPEESKFPSLKDLKIMNCPEFRSLPEEMHASLPSLQSLYIHGSKEFKSFPEESKFSSLKDLTIMDCPEFRSLPEEMHASLPSLQSLSIERE